MIAGKGIMHSEMPVHGPGLDSPFGLQLFVSLSSSLSSSIPCILTLLLRSDG
jgi:hypothetical protein